MRVAPIPNHPVIWISRNAGDFNIYTKPLILTNGNRCLRVCIGNDYFYVASAFMTQCFVNGQVKFRSLFLIGRTYYLDDMYNDAKRCYLERRGVNYRVSLVTSGSAYQELPEQAESMEGVMPTTPIR